MKEKKHDSIIKKFVSSLWDMQDEFDKYIIRTVLILAIILILLGIPSFFGFTFISDILNSLLEWISKTFSVPINKDKVLSIDASDILFFFSIFVIVFSWFVKKFIKSKFTRSK